jgi:uncharacterized membrane protein
MAYFAYLGLLVLLLGAIVATPLIAFQNESSSKVLYSVFAPTCHEKISRSLCLFKSDYDGYSVHDCTPQDGRYHSGDEGRIKTTGSTAVDDITVGYKFPVCSRCLALYAFMLIGAIAYPFMRKLDEKKFPAPIYFVLAVVPLALDGAWQLLSSFGVLPPYESTNLIRIITGGLAGFATSYYLLAMVMNFLSRD